MRHANTGVFAVLLLAVFLLLLAAPALFFLYGYGFLRLPDLAPLNAMVAATAGLFIIPVFLVFLAAIVFAAKRKKAVVSLKPRKAPELEHYPWEDVFRPAEQEEFRAAAAAARAAKAAHKPGLPVLAIASVIIVVSVVFFVMILPSARDAFANIGKGSNLTSQMITDTDAATKAAANEVVVRENASEKMSIATIFKSFAEKFKRTKSGEAAKKGTEAEPKQELKQKEPSVLAMKFKAAIATVSKTILKIKLSWPYLLVGIGVLVLLAAGFYFYKAKKIKPAIGLFVTAAADSVEWFAVLFTAARRNSVKIIALTVVVAAVIAVFVFRDRLRGKLSGFSSPANLSDSFFDVAFAVRDFFSAYRLYIAIGIIALLVILGILFVLERKGKEIETKEIASVKTVKTKASKK